jgi:hypothetical protein
MVCIALGPCTTLQRPLGKFKGLRAIQTGYTCGFETMVCIALGPYPALVVHRYMYQSTQKQQKVYNPHPQTVDSLGLCILLSISPTQFPTISQSHRRFTTWRKRGLCILELLCSFLSRRKTHFCSSDPMSRPLRGSHHMSV